MSETTLCYIPFIGTLILSVGCLMYALGGRGGKWKRRFIGSLLCSVAILAETLVLGHYSHVQLLAYPMLVLAFSLGYGSEIPLDKVIKRGIVVLCSLLVGVLFCVTLGGKAWLILPLQVLIASGSIWLGVKNPISAAPEEFFVCLLLTECNLMYPFIVSI